MPTVKHLEDFLLEYAEEVIPLLAKTESFLVQRLILDQFPDEWEAFLQNQWDWEAC